MSNLRVSGRSCVSAYRDVFRVAFAICALTAIAHAEEWRPRHALYPPTGVLNLTEPGGPTDVLLTGPESPADAAAWRTRMEAWRGERLERLRYDGAEYARPELSWTQHIYSQVQLLIWDGTFFDPDEHQKFLLMSPGRDRAGTIGFRCVVDAQ